MTEAELQQLIVDTADRAGWLVYHTHDSRRNRAGFPDLCLVRAPEVLFVELKTSTGRLRPDQRVWLDELEKVHTISSGLVRPEQADQLVARLLRPAPGAAALEVVE